MKLDTQILVNFIVTLCGAIITVSGAAAIVAKFLKKSLDRCTREITQEETSKIVNSFNEQLKELSRTLNEHIESIDNTNAIQNNALLALTRDQINHAYHVYMEQGYIGVHSLFVLEELYKSYKTLGGNSFIDNAMLEIRELEVRTAK